MEAFPDSERRQERRFNRKGVVKMGPWPLPQNFNGPFRKLMGHIKNPMGHSLHAFLGFESCATDCHCIFLASFHTHFTKHLISFK
jgi:hypothetical protein